MSTRLASHSRFWLTPSFAMSVTDVIVIGAGSPLHPSAAIYIIHKPSNKQLRHLRPRRRLHPPLHGRIRSARDSSGTRAHPQKPALHFLTQVPFCFLLTPAPSPAPAQSSSCDRVTCAHWRPPVRQSLPPLYFSNILRMLSPYGADVGGSWLWHGDSGVEQLAKRFGLGETRASGCVLACVADVCVCVFV